MATPFSLPGFDSGAPAYPDLFAETADLLALAVDVQAIAEVQVAKAWRPALSSAAQTAQALEWPTWDDKVLAHIEDQFTEFDSNIAAVAVLRSIDGEARPPRASERSALLRYTGWGGIPASFNDDGRDATWVERAGRLRQLLSADDYDSARASVTGSFARATNAVKWRSSATSPKEASMRTAGRRCSPRPSSSRRQ